MYCGLSVFYARYSFVPFDDSQYSHHPTPITHPHNGVRTCRITHSLRHHTHRPEMSLMVKNHHPEAVGGSTSNHHQTFPIVQTRPHPCLTTTLQISPALTTTTEAAPHAFPAASRAYKQTLTQTNPAQTSPSDPPTAQYQSTSMQTIPAISITLVLDAGRLIKPRSTPRIARSKSYPCPVGRKRYKLLVTFS